MGALDIDLDLVSGLQSRASEGRGNAKPFAPIYRIAHMVDGKRDAPRSRPVRRGDGKEPRPQRLQDLDEGLGIGPEAGEFFNGRQHIECRGVAVRVFPLCQGFCLCPGEAAGDVGVVKFVHSRAKASLALIGMDSGTLRSIKRGLVTVVLFASHVSSR